MRFYLLLLATIFSQSSFAQINFVKNQYVDTVLIYSKAMKKNVPCIVIKPNGHLYSKEKFPVVYLLHGYSGAYNNWINKMPSLIDASNEFKSFIVCPDGGFGSWYIDSEVEATSQYETFISKELVTYIDSAYRTDARHQKRAITGLSMGGHGALMLAIRHQETFGAASSMSGAVDLKNIIKKYDSDKKFGDTAQHKNVWQKYSVTILVDTFSNQQMPIYIDCGTNDIFIQSNRILHQKLDSLKIKHDYTERTGEHNWAYWTNALPYHLLFFRNYFSRQ